MKFEFNVGLRLFEMSRQNLMSSLEKYFHDIPRGMEDSICCFLFRVVFSRWTDVFFCLSGIFVKYLIKYAVKKDFYARIVILMSWLNGKISAMKKKWKKDCANCEIVKRRIKIYKNKVQIRVIVERDKGLSMHLDYCNFEVHLIWISISLNNRNNL